MSERLKREVSLTLLRIRVLDDDAGAAAASRDAKNPTTMLNQRISCELQVTGNAEDRGLVAQSAPTSNRPLSRRKSSSLRSDDSLAASEPVQLSRTLAQWSYA